MSGEDENNILAAGGVSAVVSAAGLQPEVVTVGGQATNAMTVKLEFMKSRYLLTVERVPEVVT